MWPPIQELKIHIRPGRTDMRKQINGLAYLVENEMQKFVFSGDLFLFCGSGMKILKVLYWDKNGFCLWTKRLEKGSFAWPKSDSEQAVFTHEELDMLLDGIDFRKRFKPLKYERFG